MPAKNTVKEYCAPAFYHVYNRGAGGQNIFIDDNDRQKFLSLLQKNLSTENTNKPKVINYNIELNAFCLMNSHFHLLFFQPDEPDQLTKIMRSISTSYSMYFNKRHGLSGHVFQGIYKASIITNEAYLAHISRYIHTNPQFYMRYKWSSLDCYLGKNRCDWVHPERILDTNRQKYVRFLKEYTDKREIKKEIKQFLAF